MSGNVGRRAAVARTVAAAARSLPTSWRGSYRGLAGIPYDAYYMGLVGLGDASSATELLNAERAERGDDSPLWRVLCTALRDRTRVVLATHALDQGVVRDAMDVLERLADVAFEPMHPDEVQYPLRSTTAYALLFVDETHFPFTVVGACATLDRCPRLRSGVVAAELCRCVGPDAGEALRAAEGHLATGPWSKYAVPGAGARRRSV